MPHLLFISIVLAEYFLYHLVFDKLPLFHFMNILAKKILLTLFVIGLFCPKVSAASELDSLYQVLSVAQEDTAKVSTLLLVCWQLHRTNITETKEFANKSLELSEKLNYQRGIGESYSYLSWVYFSNGDNETALKYSYKTVIIGEKTNDPSLLNIAYNDIAMIYSETGRSEEALAIWQKSIALNLKANRVENIPITYVNMAGLLEENNNIKDARKYYMLALEASKEATNSMVISSVHLAVAEMYEKEGNIDAAEENYSKALSIAQEDGDLETSAFSLLGMSSINAKKGKKEKSQQLAQTALSLAEAIGDVYSTIIAYSKLAKIQRISKDYKNSLNSSIKVIKIAEKHNITLERIEAYKDISKTYSEIENYEQAFRFSEKYHALQDSTLSEEKATNILALEKKYQSDLKEKENTVLKLQQEEQNLQIKQKNTLNKSLFSILFLLGIVGFLAYRRYKDKHSAHELLGEKVNERTEELRLMNKNLEKSNKELERFAYIASHDLREPLRNISGFAGLLKKELNPQEGSNINEYLSFITENTSQLNTLIQDILTYSKVSQEGEELISVNPNLIISDINKSLAHSIKQKKVKIFVKSNLPILRSSGQQVYFLFKNLIENGIKYNNSTFPRIDIVCNDIGDKYEFLVKDNGIGIDPEYSAKVFEMFTRLHDRRKFKGTGLGLSFCRKIVENHGGTINVNSEKDKGSSFTFTWSKDFTEKISDNPKTLDEELTTSIN